MRSSEEEEEAEMEALSLCDFPLTRKDSPTDDQDSCRRSTAEASDDPHDFFEFFYDLAAVEMCHAEDIIFAGKLVPFKNKSDVSRRYCASLPGSLRSNSDGDSSRVKLKRSSRSLDSKVMRRQDATHVGKSETPIVNGFLSKRSMSKTVKPRWYGVLFGTMKLPAEMDLRDIKTRQFRRGNGASLRASESRSSDRRNSWSHDFLKVLSCKDHASVATTVPSLNTVVPQVLMK